MRKANVVRLALAMSIAAGCSAATLDERIDREIVRLETALKELEASELPKQAHDLIAPNRTDLERVKQATTAEYRLYRLREPFIGIETLSFLAEQKTATESLDRFRRLWNSEAARFAAATPPSRGSLLERGLIESASTRADRLFHASLPYASADQPWSGVYYLGEAHANLRFRDFVQSHAQSSSAADEPSPSRTRVEAMLEDLEQDTLTLFGTDVSSQQLIGVSVRLKQAREMLDSGRVDGAALLAVEARAALSRRGGPHHSYPDAGARRAASVAAVLEAWAGEEKKPFSDALRGEVTEFYRALFVARGARPAAEPARVTVTLVRWPYT